ncbi:hypothetical protein FHS97_002993 [Sphingomonas endophytica]|uniref:Uncharacterized protein n=1 Tax=Sphingomonas endophytica TaxID=869719 RepID=A0ABR6N8A6_9SPHN|nr:hypothetical protein [Sphingomonas endophytica]
MSSELFEGSVSGERNAEAALVQPFYMIGRRFWKTLSDKYNAAARVRRGGRYGRLGKTAALTSARAP